MNVGENGRTGVRERMMFAEVVEWLNCAVGQIKQCKAILGQGMLLYLGGQMLVVVRTDDLLYRLLPLRYAPLLVKTVTMETYISEHVIVHSPGCTF